MPGPHAAVPFEEAAFPQLTLQEAEMDTDEIVARPIREAEFGKPIPVTIVDMLNEISNQGPAIPAVMDSVQPQLEALDPSILGETSHIYITGCGDSYFAGLAARYAFARYAGVPTEALEALEFGRYAAEFVPPGSVVFGISNSGKATRSVRSPCKRPPWRRQDGCDHGQCRGLACPRSRHHP